MKTQEIIDNNDGTISLHTVNEESALVTADDVAALDAAKAREILYVENDIRVLQAKLADLQGEKAKTAELAATARTLQPIPIGKDGGGGAIKVG